MKPKLGQTVYLVSPNGTYACEMTVGYLGERSFIISGRAFYWEDWHERLYSDEGKTWFASFNDLKKTYPNAINYMHERYRVL